MRSAVTTHEGAEVIDAGAEAFDESISHARVARGAWPRLLSGEDVRWLAAWTAVAFALRLLLLVGVEHVISPDGVAYATLGRNLAAGNFANGLSTYWPPLYPALVGAASLVFDDVEFAGRFVSVVAGALLVVPVYAIARASYGRESARLAAAMAAVHPVLVYYSTVLLTEATYTLLFACGVAAGWSALTRARARAFFLTGALFGACYLLKPEAAGFVLLLAALALAANLFGGARASLSKRVRHALALCAGFVALALPYVVYMRAETGAWTISEKLAEHMWQGSRRAGEFVPPEATYLPDLTTALVQLTKALRHEYEVLNLIFPTVFVVLLALGLFGTRWTKERARREFYLLAFVAATLAGYAVTLPNVRFFVPLLPILLCWLARGVFEFEDWAAATAENFRGSGKFSARGARLVVRPLVVRPLVVAVLVASLVPVFVYLLRGDKWGDYYGQKRAALWVKERAEGRAPVVMSSAPVAPFYAGGQYVELVDEELAAMIERARRYRVDYIIINERGAKLTRLRALLDAPATPLDIPRELRLVHSLAESPGHRILVYTLAGDAEEPREEGVTP